MSTIIAKKYALALESVCSESELETVTSYVEGVSALYKDSKFIDVIKSPLVSKEEKALILTDKLTEAPSKFNNFIKILAGADRLMVIPKVAEELSLLKASKSNSYKGVVASDRDLEVAKIGELKNALSSKLGVTLDLETKKDDYDGVKVEVRDMGLRIDFSQSHIKEQMLVHILKAI